MRYPSLFFREEAAARLREHARARKALAPERQEAARLKTVCFERYAPAAERSRLCRLEKRIRAEEQRLERLLREAREARERAVRREAPYFGNEPGPTTRAALADYAMGRFREALARGDDATIVRRANEVRRYDDARRHEAELLGRGTLTVQVAPPEANVYLFRYEDYDTVRTGPPVVSRLVPVPTTGIGRCKTVRRSEAIDFVPGDLCLVILEVTPGSPAAAAGLAPGDLVLRLNGRLAAVYGGDPVPVLGISWRDLQTYLAWQNRKAPRTGQARRYDLPTEQEWEKAAPGADGRFFPWGNRFDFTLTVGLFRKKSRLFTMPVMYEPRDESPFGVRDLGGSRIEWTSSRFEGTGQTHVLQGGAWGHAEANDFRSAARGGGPPRRGRLQHPTSVSAW